MTTLTLDRIELNYGPRQALRDVSLAFPAGQVTALVGPNGAGKSSLLRVCAGLAEPAAGEVRLGQCAIGSLSDVERAKRLAFLPADGRSAWPLVARRIVALGRAPFLKPLRGLSAADEDAIDLALDRAEARHLADRPFNTLSSGERARILIARTLATQADVLLLDEPVAALDLNHQLAVMEIARHQAEQGGLVIMAIHALDLVARFADRVVLIQDGSIQADGSAEDALSEENVRRVFGVVAPGGVKPTPLSLTDAD
jgi:iron complex transport system ATP-binding protein